MTGWIPYTIWPDPEPAAWPGGEPPLGPIPEVAEPPKEARDTAGTLGQVGALCDIFLGYEQGIPVRALVAWDGQGWRMVRLVTTDPALFLEPALAPGATLPLPWPGYALSPF